MLYDSDRPKISETAQHQIEETRIEKITALTVTKFGTGQFSQRRREITPGIGIGNWSQGKREALPDCPGKNDREGSPITKPPKRICFPAGTIDCLRDAPSFQGAAQSCCKNYGLSPAPVG